LTAITGPIPEGSPTVMAILTTGFLGSVYRLGVRRRRPIFKLTHNGRPGGHGKGAQRVDLCPGLSKTDRHHNDEATDRLSDGATRVTVPTLGLP
jgi:hypothetical protein